MILCSGWGAVLDTKQTFLEAGAKAWGMASTTLGGGMHMVINGQAEVALFASEKLTHCPLWLSRFTRPTGAGNNDPKT